MLFNERSTKTREQHDSYDYFYGSLQSVKYLIRRQTQTATWVQQLEQALNFSCVVASQDFAGVVSRCCKADLE